MQPVDHADEPRRAASTLIKNYEGNMGMSGGCTQKPQLTDASLLMDSELYYLAPGYDHTKLTKPKLRSILGEHGVTDLPPANAKKEVLLELFERHVKGRAQEILKQRQGVKASGAGITFLDEQSQPSPKLSVKSSPKMSVEISPKKQSRKPSPTRTRGRSPSPIKLPFSPTRGRSPSPKNQSPQINGSTKADIKKPRSKSKTAGSRSRSKVRETPVRALQDALPARTDSPASATLKLQRRLGYIASANNMSLAQEAITPVYADSPSRMKGLPSPSHTKKLLLSLGGILLGFFKFLMAFLLTIFLAIYLRWKFVYPIPYCESGAAPRPFYPEVDMMTSLRALCLTCPEHGTCNNGRLTCAEGYTKKTRWLFLGETCETDWERFSKAEALLKTLKLVLRERQGAFQCKQCPTPTLAEPAVKNVLKSHRFKKASWAGEDFDSYYRLAIMDIMKDPDHHGIKIMGGSDTSSRIFLSTVATFSLRCQVYILASYFYQTYRNHLLVSLAFLIGTVYIYWRWKLSSWERRKVDELVQTVLQCLAEQDALNRRDPSRPATLSVPQLRDALFMNSSAKEKARLWPKVCAAMASNSNVRESVMSIKGEQHRVWEWIGMDVLAPFTKIVNSEA